MNAKSLPRLSALAWLCVATSALAQEKSAPITAAEKEAAYAAAIQNRAVEIVVAISLKDAAKSNKVTEIILAQYRALRARDEEIDSKVKALPKDAAITETTRAELFRTLSKPLHDQFTTQLAAELTPEQIEIVKDKMTYGKVKVTYEAYCAIFPTLTDADKAKITAVLKEAREEAIDGGSAAEKSRIFAKYKDRINDYLNANGHNVAKAYQDWEAKQAALKPKEEASAGSPGK